MNKIEKSDNEIIAEFMGIKVSPVGCIWYDDVTKKRLTNVDDLEYCTSWSWLMPVVEKINSLPKTAVSIYPQHCIISVDGSAESGAINQGGDIMPLIAIVYPAVVKFIKWYQNERVR